MSGHPRQARPRPDPVSAARSRRLRVVAGALLLSSGAMLPVALTGALAVRLQRDLDVGAAVIGVAVSAFFVGGGLAGIAVSRRVDRQGWRRSSTEAAALATASLLGVALLGRTWWALALALAVGGVAFTVQVPSANVAVSQEIRAERLGSTLGLTQSAVPVAMLAAGLAVPTLAAVVDWHVVFGVAAAWPIAGALVLPAGAVPVGQVDAGRPRGHVSGAGTIALASFLASFVPGALTGFFVVSAVAAGLAEATAGAVLAGCSAAGLSVRMSAGVLADRSGTDGYRPVAAMLVVGAAGLVLLAVGTPATTAAGGLLAFAGGWGWPGLWFYALVRSHADAAGAVTGAVQAGGMIGSAVGPLLFGVIVDARSTATAWLAVAAVTAVAAVLVRRAAPPAGQVAEGRVAG